jgi:acetoin utilization protein AcuB
MLVRDLMTPRPVTIGPTQTVLKALLLMYQKDIRRLPVVEGDRLIGIVSDRDIKQVMTRPSRGRKPREDEEAELVENVMTREIVSVRQGDDVKTAIELIVNHRISGLPVLGRDGKLVGVISEIDILRYCLDLLEQNEKPPKKR